MEVCPVCYDTVPPDGATRFTQACDHVGCADCVTAFQEHSFGLQAEDMEGVPSRDIRRGYTVVCRAKCPVCRTPSAWDDSGLKKWYCPFCHEEIHGPPRADVLRAHVLSDKCLQQHCGQCFRVGNASTVLHCELVHNTMTEVRQRMQNLLTPSVPPAFHTSRYLRAVDNLLDRITDMEEVGRVEQPPQPVSPRPVLPPDYRQRIADFIRNRVVLNSAAAHADMAHFVMGANAPPPS
jgi:hypothetical protein